MATAGAGRIAGGRFGATAGDPLLIALVACGLIGLVSLFGATSQVQAMDEGAIVLGVAGAIAALSLSRTPAALVPRTRTGLAWTAFVVWALVAALLSGRVWPALVGEVSNLLGWFTVASLSAIILAVYVRRGEARRVLSVIAPVVVFAQTAAATVQLVQGFSPRGTLPNTSYLGQALLLLLPFVVDEEDGPLPLSRTARYALVAAAVLVLAAGGSRAAMLVALAWCTWLFLKRSPWKPALKATAVIVLVVLVLAFGTARLPKEFLGSFELDTLGGREKMWHAAALAVAERPLTGYGPDGFVAGAVSVTTPELARRAGVVTFDTAYAVDPHALPVWVVVSTGLVGLALFLWALAEATAAWLRSRRLSGRDATDPTAPAWACAGAVAVFCTAPVALQVVPLLGLVVGAALAPAGAADREPARIGVIAGRTAVVLLGLSALLFTSNAAARLPLENHSAERSVRLAPRAQAASDLWRVDPHLAHLAALHWGWVARTDRRVAAAQPDLAAIERALALDRRNPFIALEHARTLRFYGAPNDSLEQALLEAIRRWPLYPRARAEYAVVLAQAGRTTEAREQMAIAQLVDDGDAERVAALDAARRLLEGRD